MSGTVSSETFEEVSVALREIYELLKDDHLNPDSRVRGELASYIPELTEANPAWFGISFATVDGQLFEIGDTNRAASIQSTSKPMNMAMAIEEHGLKHYMKHLNVEPSGRAFNSDELDMSEIEAARMRAQVLTPEEEAEAKTSDEPPRARPFNSMVNSGAITTATMIAPTEPIDSRLKKMLHRWREVAGDAPVGTDTVIFNAEKRTAFKNLKIVYDLLENKVYPDGTTEAQALEGFNLYLQGCSITMTTTGLARFAAMLANSGVIPGTSTQCFRPEVARYVLSVMFSSGMYKFSGRWQFLVGAPAKSGVSGFIYVVLPRVGGICVFSPLLDTDHNSARGVKLFLELSRRFNIHVFDTLSTELHTRKSLKNRYCSVEQIALLGDACATGDREMVARILKSTAGLFDLNQGDYDRRRPLHVAVESEKLDLAIVSLLLEYGADPTVVDKWGMSPLKYAEEQSLSDVVSLFSSHEAVIRLREGEGGDETE